MTPRRKETALPMDEAPIRFYKFVALTFLIITVILLGLIIFMSSKRATIEITTKESPIDVTLGMTFGEGADVPAVVTTTVLTLQDTFEPTGDKEVEGQATGIITITNDSATPQPLVATTRFLSAEGILFRLFDGVTVPANGSIEAEVYADQDGATGDIGPSTFTIPGLNATRQTQVYGNSTAPMTGGVRAIGILSEPDIARAEEQLRAKAIEQISNLFTESSTDKTVLVNVVNIASESNEAVGDEISEFTVRADIELVAVQYDPALVRSYADASLKQREIDDTEVIQPAGADPVVTFDSYDAEMNAVSVSMFHSGLAMLNAESKQLEKIMFFGKTKDEVRRYLLSLDHVHSVEVKFTPAWIRTVPHVHDHVHVLVKEVK